MKKSVVEKSILARFLNIFLPFYCRGCGKVGSLLCDSCKNNIKIVGEVIGSEDGWKVSVEGMARPGIVELGEIDRLFVGGVREGALLKLVEDYKFKSIKDISGVLVELLDKVVPEDLPGEVAVVPLPTIRRHIRERGFDHTWRLAEEFSRKKGWQMLPVLRRVNKTVQVGASEELRRKQAEGAYEVSLEKLDKDKTYILLDDVWTTGASMRAAAKKLRAEGAKRVYSVVVCISC